MSNTHSNLNYTMTTNGDISIFQFGKYVLVGLCGWKYIKTQLINLVQNKSFYINLKNKKEFIVDLVAVIHSVALTVYGASKYIYNPNNSDGCYGILSICLSYFIQDLVNLDFNYQNLSFILHHILAIILNISGFYIRSVHHLIAPFSLIELSSIFLNLAYILQILGLKKSYIFKLNYILFVISFFITRIIWMPGLIYKYILYKPISDIKIVEWCIILLSTLNLVWFKFIIRKFVKVINYK